MSEPIRFVFNVRDLADPSQVADALVRALEMAERAEQETPDVEVVVNAATAKIRESNLSHLDNVTGVTFDGAPQSAAEARASEAEAERATLAERVRTKRLAHGLTILGIAEAIVPKRDPKSISEESRRMRYCRLLTSLEAGHPAYSAGDLDAVMDALGLCAMERDEWHSANGTLPEDFGRALVARPDLWDRIRDLLSTPRRSR
jgi:hypothetical protein